MADDALMRKNAEMGKMTEARLAWARECGRSNLPCPSDRELDAFNEGFRRAQALSLESVREEALKAAAKVCDQWRMELREQEEGGLRPGQIAQRESSTAVALA